ncbi:ImmA/IrrE family metallo-endopeptidase [Photobacterium leiognathi]|uniref:ImmA/IrrE family metallo-endopeptidase n=1 Tax=Photobacterium leiognathi TaxID=553611 RepID=UPI00076AB6FA|nr:ImmA/IrrE family metallo-endopeptidase [Photobacterium leiognathi]
MNKSPEWNRLSTTQQQIIEEFHSEYPVKLGALAKRLNLIVKKATLPANISGQIKDDNGVITIKINAHDTKPRQRYTLAHEIAHFFLHRHLLQNGISDDVLYRSVLSNSIEAEANRLAADIIMPLNQVDHLMTKHSDKEKLETTLEHVSQELCVSVTALKLRLNKL